MRRPRSPWLATLASAALLSLPGAMPPAHAAATVDFCFRWESGAAYQNNPTNLMYWDEQSGGWQYERQYGETDGTGCGHYYDLPRHKRLRVLVLAAFGSGGYSYSCSGWSPYSAGPGAHRVHLGTGVVKCYR